MGTAKRPLGGEGPLGERERASEEAVRGHWCWIHEEKGKGSRDQGNYGAKTWNVSREAEVSYETSGAAACVRIWKVVGNRA